MEWLLFALIALAAAAYIVIPRANRDVPADAGDALRAERAGLLALLRELDDDLAAGRISPEDRTEGRRAIAPRLREVTEALDSLGEPREAEDMKLTAAGAEPRS
jgi:hypothetical protein